MWRNFKRNIKKNIKEDKFLSNTSVENILEEIISNFRETTSKKINLLTGEDKNKFLLYRTPELVYGLRNFIGNAIKFSKKKVDIIIESNKEILEIFINDDGPGFPEDIIELIGEPYIKSKSSQVLSNAGTGLGTFLGKTLLERKLAHLTFSKDKKLGGASVIISWKIVDLTSIS